MANPKLINKLVCERRWRLLLLACLTLALSSAVSRSAEETAAGESSKFLRFVATSADEGHVDTAIVTYKRQDGISVALVGAVHIADGDYYTKLQAHFKDYDAVLYEMVKPKEMPASGAPASASPISMLQIGMKRLLALEFQLDAIDYSPANFVHADMDTATFRRHQDARGESILGLLIRAALDEQNLKAASQNSADGFQLLLALMSKDSAHKLKFLLAHQLETMESILSGIDQGPDGKGSVILSGRNQFAMDVLTAELKKGKRNLAIFYGAGHMPDLEKRLLKEGFRKSTDRWMTAWDIRQKKLPQ